MVEDIILANSDRKELGVIQNSNITVDVNGEYEFSVQIARSNWYAVLMCILSAQNTAGLSEKY